MTYILSYKAKHRLGVGAKRAMPTFDSTPFVPGEFSGVARLFPLPNLVVFPHAIQPLHIFEPRYRAMLADALAGDHLIAMALLKRVDEQTYAGVPQIEPMTCLGKVISSAKLPDGRSNIVLCGVHRARVVEELENGREFRQAQVELVSDVYPQDDQLDVLQAELIRAIEDWLPDVLHRDEQFRSILRGELTLGAMSDILANCLPLEVILKQSLLAEADVARRGLLLLERIQELGLGNHGPTMSNEREDDPFPPHFSDN